MWYEIDLPVPGLRQDLRVCVPQVKGKQAGVAAGLGPSHQARAHVTTDYPLGRDFAGGSFAQCL